MNKVHRKRVIPVLLLNDGDLVKSKKFTNYTYIGDPINAVRIFNEKEVDEIIILDIQASKKNKQPDISAISDIAVEAFMPLAYGGGITQIEQAEKLFYNGVEKLIFNSVLHTTQGCQLVSKLTHRYGIQAIVASIDVKYNLWGKASVYSHSDQKVKYTQPLEFVRMVEDLGVGELFLNVVNRDGTYLGYDLELIQKISDAVQIPVIVCGGASSEEDFFKAQQSGASAMAAGSMFVFQRPHNAVLISYINESK